MTAIVRRSFRAAIERLGARRHRRFSAGGPVQPPMQVQMHFSESLVTAQDIADALRWKMEGEA